MRCVLMKPVRMESDFSDLYVPKYFSRTEFVTANPSCTLEQMNPDFLRKLDKLREYCGFPLLVNCFYRSVEHDKAKGRSGNSYHCKGRAADIYCTDSYKRFAIVHNASYVGLNGIGIYERFIHVDDRLINTMWYGK